MPIDMSAAKAPPRKVAPRQGTSTRVKVDHQSEITTRRTEAMLGLGQIGQGLCVMAGQFADAATIGRYWEAISQEVVPIAQMSGAEWLGTGLDLLVKIGPYTALSAVLIPFGMQILANHKMLDASKLGGQGVVPPEVLEAQMKAQSAQMEVEALKAKNEALQYAAQMQQEHAQAMREYQSLTNPEASDG